MHIGFKEWLGVCAHLGGGTSSLLLRKGGIHEGRAGFSFKHERFFLFPTGFHEAADGLKVPAPATDAGIHPADPANGVCIPWYAVAGFACLVRDREVIRRLAPFHVWTDAVVDERYSYSEKLEADCLSVAFVRVYRLARPWHFPYDARFGGCRSWVALPEPPAGWEQSLQPVLDDAEHLRRETALRAILAGHEGV